MNKLKFHFVGVGGIGMSALVEFIMAKGHLASGSDPVINETISRLVSKGMQYYSRHEKENVNDSDFVVVSSAITLKNPEINEAVLKKIPILKRGQLLAQLMLLKKGITVCGTHGKTTTTSFLATIFIECNEDPMVFVGGILKASGSNARVGNGDYFISEVDESDGSFLLISPIATIVTNIDNDHLDYYQSFENLSNSFLQYINKIPFYGKSVINIDDHHLNSFLENINSPFVTYSMEKTADYEAKNLRHNLENSTFDLYYAGSYVCEIKIQLPGRHNVSNALAAIALSHELGLSFERIKDSIVKFIGVGRRLEKLYELKTGFCIYDDYAHHPTEIKTLLETVSELTNKKIITLFEPHRFTRTKNCWHQFITCFDMTDELYILPIYPASELPIEGITTSNLVAQIEVNSDCKKVEELSSYEEIYKLIRNNQTENVILLTVGAGPISKKMKEIISHI